MSAFRQAELAGWVADAYAMLGDIPVGLTVIDYFAGAYDPLSLDNTPGTGLAFPAQALVTRFRAAELAPETVLSTDRKAAIRQTELPGVVPTARDRLTLGGQTWYVCDVHHDTGRSLWVLQIRRDSEGEDA